MSIFFKDILNNKIITWDQLIDDINCTSSYNPFCMTLDYYTVFKNIIISLLLDDEITLLDSDFTNSELLNLTGKIDFLDFNKKIDSGSLSIISNKMQLIEKINSSNKKWKVTMFTSGTTGIPKKVSHDFKIITRFVKLSEEHKKNIWGFAYNPTHMAGLQVFFQALLNGSSIIRLFGLNNNSIYSEINDNKISHISATPTFYKLILPCESKFPSVKRITSGGEKFSENIFEQLGEVFPNAKITNVYASTEAGTLFASENNVFKIKPEYESLIRVENNELIIHNSLIGKTGSKDEKWYYTGDIIEIISENPIQFSFVSRKNEMINIGGYKVNPLEVEEAIQSLEGVKNVRVYSKPNSVLGNIICSEVVIDDNDINESTLRTYLQSRIQEFKIPRIIQFVDTLSTTKTGKLKRK